MKVAADLSSLPKMKANKKKMLSIEESESAIHVFINFSSLDIIQDCARKAFYRLERKLEHLEEAPALTTGSGVHKAMEVWYAAPQERRKNSSFKTDENIQKILAEQSLADAEPCARTAAIHAYYETVKSLKSNPDLGARDPGNVANILDKYFDYYLNDDYILYSNSDGPFLERSFELEVPLSKNTFNGKRLKIFYFGTIDMILVHKITNNLHVCDHKTTHSLGKDFLNRIKPNFQYVGYFWGARDYFKVPVDGFIVNGIQIAKTKLNFNRQTTYIHDEEIEELWVAAEDAVRRFLDYRLTERWPMSAPNSCSMWGGCEYRRICESPKVTREVMIRAEYSE